MIGLIRAEDLDRWVSRITSAPGLPRLVRRLVHATARGLRQVDFPGDEAIRLAGWDGKVLAGAAAPFVPDGFSAWELGTGHDPRAKANEDYGKRTGKPPAKIMSSGGARAASVLRHQQFGQFPDVRRVGHWRNCLLQCGDLRLI